MRIIILAFTAATALGLGGCGSDTSGEFTTADGEAGEYTIDKDTGETRMTIKGEDGEAILRAGTGVPVSLPPGFTLLPGSTVTNNVVVDEPDEQGTMITFEADASADRIIAHYRDAAKAAGFDIQVEMNTNGALMAGGERKSDGATFTVTASGSQPASGQIILATRKPG